MDFLSRIEARRRVNYGLDGPRLTSADQALAFIDRVGLCLLSPHDSLLLPGLIPIADGRPRLWRDQLLTERRVYYGQRFHGRTGFISLSLLPAVYALTPTAEFRGDRFELYRYDYLSAEANQLVGTVLAKGPVAARSLRRATGMAGETQRYQFSKALEEAEAQFLVVKVAAESTRSGSYTYIWDSFARAWPEIVEGGAALAHEEAGRAVIGQYLQTVVAATLDQIVAALTLSAEFIQYFLDKLEAEGVLARQQVDDAIYWYIPDSPRRDENDAQATEQPPSS